VVAAAAAAVSAAAATTAIVTNRDNRLSRKTDGALQEKRPVL
jgi:hypothetical protein